MISRLLGLMVVLCLAPLSAQADPVAVPAPYPYPDPCYEYPGSCVPPSHHEFCKEYNRDGITCDEVGFHEGQVGYPWGSHSGRFRCVNGCLAWLDQENSCKAYNRDGTTCHQVGFHEGQIGYPWGFKSGKFRCEKGCLQFLWWW